MFRKGDYGFQVVCDNGYVVSVQFGFGNYCDNQHTHFGSQVDECANAEIAVLDGEGNFIQLGEYDDVVGYQSVADFVRILSAVSSGRISDLTR